MKQIFVSTMMLFSCNLLNANPVEYASMNNQECKVRPEIVNVNSNAIVLSRTNTTRHIK